jgi:hypothetical protein
MWSKLKTFFLLKIVKIEKYKYDCHENLFFFVLQNTVSQEITLMGILMAVSITHLSY